jgi:hypothetical protein
MDPRLRQRSYVLLRSGAADGHARPPHGDADGGPDRDAHASAHEHGDAHQYPDPDADGHGTGRRTDVDAGADRYPHADTHEHTAADRHAHATCSDAKHPNERLFVRSFEWTRV